MQGKGKYYISKFKSSGCRIIGHETRVLMNSKSISPGVGKYRLQLKYVETNLLSSTL